MWSRHSEERFPKGIGTGCAALSASSLERSCGPVFDAGDWLHERHCVAGVTRLRASLRDKAYSRHRHDTYTIAVTERGVQEFNYRGTVYRSLPGQVVILHPDELHDGRPGTNDGFAYCTVYLDPGRAGLSMGGLHASSSSLPFVVTPVVDDPALARTVLNAFDAPMESLATEELVQTINEALWRWSRCTAIASKHKALSDSIVLRAREFLDANFTRTVRAEELESTCGENRFAICTRFKQHFGTSPYRYLLMRRLDFVRRRLPVATSLAALAHDAGFADQAHLTRLFRAAYGMTPSVYARLCNASTTKLRNELCV
jgi:AraC-like DNA-binding protein